MILKIDTSESNKQEKTTLVYKCHNLKMSLKIEENICTYQLLKWK